MLTQHLRRICARTICAALGGGAFALVAAACDPMVTGSCDDLYAKQVSPDGRFAVVVNRCEMRFSLPGQVAMRPATSASSM